MLGKIVGTGPGRMDDSDEAGVVAHQELKARTYSDTRATTAQHHSFSDAFSP